MSTNFTLPHTLINASSNSVAIRTRDKCSSYHPSSHNNRFNRNCRKTTIKSEPFVFLIMRLNLKAVLFLLIIAVIIITFAVYMRWSDFIFPHDFMKPWRRRFYDSVSGDNKEHIPEFGKELFGNNNISQLHNIKCIINQEEAINCKRDPKTNEVYVPFSFLHDYFEISGTLTSAVNNKIANVDEHIENSENLKFYWMHSNAKVNLPKGRYDAHGIFTYFENYNVEVRDRVKCISAAEGVPVSTQWEKRGYFYPTQIAQFALSHYSKNLTESSPKIKILENGDGIQIDWIVPKGSNINRLSDSKLNTTIIQFETAIDYDSAINININQTLDLVLNIDIFLNTNSSSLMITVYNRDTKHFYRLHYIPADLLISVQDDNIYYGMGSKSLKKWHHLTRDVLIDIQKGLSPDRKTQTKIRRTELSVVSVSFLGIGYFDNLTFSTYNHIAHFYDAAEWFINYQNTTTGGWPNPVKRSVNGFNELNAGWLSAMGQGHAISVLARAYWHSGGDTRYLRAAALGLKPFNVISKNGGVQAKFMDKFYWYEEYPTTPPSFVLNGFIFSLLGLYDLNATAPSKIAREAGKLFEQGMVSLKKMLMLYDTGSGTSYDLRHLSLGVAPNLARWDYHATHVNQLLLLATIDSDPVIVVTAERWKGYMFGKRAKHN